MNSLTSQLLKEFRLLLPAWIIAAICVCLPIARRVDVDQGPQLFVVCIGLILLSVRAFGAEFSQGTFTLYLSQPTQRNRLWLVKVAALAVAMASVIALWHRLALSHWRFLENVSLTVKMPYQPWQPSWLWLIALVTTGSGLFFSVLLRQATAALWATIIAPLTLSFISLAVISWWSPEGAKQITDILAQPLLICYGVLSGFGSWLLFRCGQDLDRFNVVVDKSISLGGGAKGWAARLKLFHSPGSALLAKELGLQQINFGVAVLLMALYFLVVGLGHWVPKMHQNAYLKMSRDMVLLLWIVLPPLLIGCVAIAEERRLNVMTWHRTLPISTWRQWLIKLMTVWGMTLLISVVLPLVVIGLNEKSDLRGEEVWNILIATLGLATLGLFVSSLSKSFLSAFGVSLAIGIGLALLVNAMAHHRHYHWLANFLQNRWDAVGLLRISSLFIGVGLPLALLFLIHKNMKLSLPSGNDVIFNVITVLGAVGLSGLLSAAVFYRTWEFFVPYPEPQSVVRLQGKVLPKIEGSWSSSTILLPDGRLISPRFSNFFKSTNFTFAVIGITTNDRWQDVAVGSSVAHGIRADGTLWSWGTFWPHSENKPQSVDPKKINPAYFQPPGQIGTGSDWKSVSAGFTNAFALQRDHSLWAWGNNSLFQFGNGTTNSSTTPVRVGSENDWAQVSTTGAYSLGLKSDGSLWEWGTDQSLHPNQTNAIPARLDLPTDWAEIKLAWGFALGIKKDGSLWLIKRLDGNLKKVRPYKIYQVGRDSDWKTVGTSSSMAIKKDGSLWNFSIQWKYNPQEGMMQIITEPKRVGKSTNWIAAGNQANLAADGSFIGRPFNQGEAQPPNEWRLFLSLSRRCPFVFNFAQGNTP